MCTKPLKYTFATQVYQKAIEVTIDIRCNGLVVKNSGTSGLVFQGDLLVPTESRSIGGNFAEILSGRVDLSFTGAGTNSATITQKFYLPGQWIDKELGL